MFLPHVERHEPKERSRYANAIRASEAAGSYISGIWRLFAFRPKMADHLSRLTHEVLRGESELSPGLRELIAAFTSARNQCLF